MSTNLVKQNVLVPKEESSSGSDMEFHESQQSQKKSVMKKVKTFVGRMLSARHRHKPASSGAPSPQEALLPHPQSLPPGGAQELPPPRLRSTPRTRKLSQNGNHGHCWLGVEPRGVMKLGWIFLLPKVWHVWELVCNADPQAPPCSTESVSACQKDPQVTLGCTYILKNSELDCL